MSTREGDSGAGPADEGVNETREVIESPPIGEEVNNLPVQVAVVVPSTRKDEQVSDKEFKSRIERARTWFSKRFGGDTTVRGSGGYVMDGDLIDEPVAIVESSMSIETYRDRKDDFAAFVKRKRESWEQDTVMYRVEDRIFIYPHRDYIDDGSEVPDDFVRVI